MTYPYGTLKIALITFTTYGAAVHYVSQLANALTKQHRVSVCLPGYTDTSYFSHDVSLFKLPIPARLLPALARAFHPHLTHTLMHTLSDIKADVVHLVFEHRFPFYYAKLLGHQYPFVVTFHEPAAVPNRGFIANGIVSVLQFLNNTGLAMSADKIIVHSDKLRAAHLLARLPVSKIDVVQIGTFNFFKANTTDATESNNLLFFGRIARYKGIEYLIEAAQKAKTSMPDLTVTIAGEGDLSKYRKMIRGESWFAIINRYIPDDEVAGLFGKAAVLIMPYTDGSQTGLISVAAAFSKPVIVSNVGNFSDMVDDGTTGLIIPPGDVSALSDAIITLLKNPQLRCEMGENAKRKFSGSHFSWGAIAVRTQDIYQQAVSLHKSKSGTS
jgi:glycosyltransferase involved in cell wall biosynthesis